MTLSELIGTEREYKRMQKILRDNERIIYCTPGFMNDHTWLISLTNQRVVFINVHLLFDVEQFEIPLGHVNSVELRKGIFFSSITIRHGSSEYKIENVFNDRAREFTSEIGKITTDRTKCSEFEDIDRRNTGSIGVADEISKLKSLLDAGAISKDEYQTLKNRVILGK